MDYTLKEMHERISELIEDAEYRVTKARSPKSKRQGKLNVEFFQSIKKHLKPLEK